MKELKLIELTPDNIPEGEVIAINQDNTATVGLIEKTVNGYKCRTSPEWIRQVTYNITHYIRIPKIH